jgi:serine/threonine-protein kinase greatwall
MTVNDDYCATANTSFTSTFHDDMCQPTNLQTPPLRSEFGRIFTPKSYRTPKTLRKNRHVVIDTPKSGHIFGTPDYLCPELLLGNFAVLGITVFTKPEVLLILFEGKKHDESVDWWALGICLYEFLVGITPFSGSSPQDIFDNIFRHEIEWPENEEALSPDAIDCIQALLDPVPHKRLTLSSLKAHGFFQNVNWDNLISEQAPFIPMPDHNTDTYYFETRNSMQNKNMLVDE